MKDREVLNQASLSVFSYNIGYVLYTIKVFDIILLVTSYL